MKQISLILLFLGLFCCQSSKIVNNEVIKSQIDKLPDSKIVTEVEVDSNGKIIDTLARSFFKYDKSNKKRYVKEEIWINGLKTVWINYHKSDEDLFYREGFDHLQTSIFCFEAISNHEGIVIRSIQIYKETNPFDTTFMNYSYQYYADDKIKELRIKTQDKTFKEIESITKFGKNGKAISEISTSGIDTFSIQNWIYLDDKLLQSDFFYYQIDTTKRIFHFGVDELLVKEEKYEYSLSKYHKTKETKHYYNKNGERIKSREFDLKLKKHKLVKYLIEK